MCKRNYVIYCLICAAIFAGSWGGFLYVLHVPYVAGVSALLFVLAFVAMLNQWAMEEPSRELND